MSRPACWTAAPEAHAVIAQIRHRDFLPCLTHNQFYDDTNWKPTSVEGWCVWDALEVIRGDWLIRHPGVKAKSLSVVAHGAVVAELQGLAA